jgi:hypothetical protein
MIGPETGVLLLLAAAPAPPAAPPRCAGVPLPVMVERYATLTRTQDIRQLSRLYGRNGLLIGPDGAPITGAGEVEQYLSRFAGYLVSDDTLVIDRIEPVPGGWRSTGHFSQHGTTPDKKPYAAQGSFVADWACERHSWRVLRMRTASGEAQ